MTSTTTASTESADFIKVEPPLEVTRSYLHSDDSDAPKIRLELKIGDSIAMSGLSVSGLARLVHEINRLENVGS